MAKLPPTTDGEKVTPHRVIYYPTDWHLHEGRDVLLLRWDVSGTSDAKKSDYKARASDDEVRAYIPLDRIAYWTATN